MEAAAGSVAFTIGVLVVFAAAIAYTAWSARVAVERDAVAQAKLDRADADHAEDELHRELANVVNAAAQRIATEHGADDLRKLRAEVDAGAAPTADA